MSRLAVLALALTIGCALDPVPLEGRICRSYLDCLTAQGYYCQSVDGGVGVDAGLVGVCARQADASTQGAVDAGRDAAAVDASRGDARAADGSAIDASAIDAAIDASLDVGPDAPAIDSSAIDAATIDAASDSAMIDAAPFDAALDASSADAAVDGG